MDRQTLQAIKALAIRCDAQDAQATEDSGGGSRALFDQLVDTKAGQALLAHAVEARGRADAADLPYAARQLEYVYEQTIEQPYPELGFANQQDPILPWDKEVPEGAETFTTYLMDFTAQAVAAALLGDGDLPRVTLLGASHEGRIENFILSYDYSQRELRRAAFANQPLEVTKARAVKRGHDKAIHQIGAWGNEEIGLRGLFNHPNVAIADVSTKAGGGTAWANATPTEIIADVNAVINGIPDNSNEHYRADMLLLPGPQMRILMTRTLSNGADGMTTTILEFLQKAHPEVRFRITNDLRAVDSLGNLDRDAMFAYQFDRDMASLVVPMYYRIYPLQEDGLNVVIPSETELGGVRMTQPLSAARADGI